MRALRVIVVEEDSASRVLCLEALGPITEVLPCASCAEARALHGADALVARLRAGPFGALQLLRELRARDPRLAAVMVVDSEVPRDLRGEARLLGCRLVSKPWTATELRMALLAALAGLPEEMEPGGATGHNPRQARLPRLRL